jgi:hypothetical protein
MILDFGTLASVSYIFGLPLMLGLLVVFWGPDTRRRHSVGHSLMAACIVVLFLTLTQNHPSGFSLAMIAPFALMTTLGSLTGHVLAGFLRRFSWMSPAVGALLVLSVGTIEYVMPKPQRIGSVTSTIVVDAERQSVWANMVRVPEIQPEENRDDLIGLFGIPRPVSAHVDTPGIGGIRHITWGQGVHLREHITWYRHHKGFDFRVSVDKPSLRAAGVDTTMFVGSDAFDVPSGSYRLRPKGRDRWEVALTCDYRINSTAAFYGEWYARFFLREFNTNILHIIKARSEAGHSPRVVCK